MGKYRLLTKEELNTFRKEFIAFLVVNGISPEDWEELKEQKKEKAEELLALFSDGILQNVLEGVKFLEVFQKNYIQTIQCHAEKMIMVALSTSDKDIDLRNISMKTDFTSIDFQIHKAEKSYTDERELELFKLTEKGFQLSDGELYKKLLLASIQ
jgi:hypothetical protein